ncbi:type I restriction enzyme, R subunit [Fodinibius roseus]|uniref:Type I restriction enzyme, R subunit n=1 Tax=Fodinibius roseus TaxID=1194090 RepID=A0A1M5EAR3_9BACT|nr:type I restriction endonuclease [Fodinibius roseus]SHF76318.1 type I restriction enzyme, R subunit [Fodinibius roseus]
MSINYKEIAFEKAIEAFLCSFKGGYKKGDPSNFNRKWALFPELVTTFIKDTQPRKWGPIEQFYGDDTENYVIKELHHAINSQGILNVIRHGFKCFGKRLRVAFFRPPHGMNPESEELYQRNVLTFTRQVHYSEGEPSKSIDIVLTLNGLPVATIELKNPLTDQNVEDAKKQYKGERNPEDLIFQFKKRALIHFAVDPDLVYYTTKLEGSDTYLLPFNKGHDGGAGNPPNPDGYRTTYLWEEVLQKDSFMDILARFLHLEVEEKKISTDQGIRVIRKENMIFPRYHQLDAVRKLVDDAEGQGPGKNYLIQHSAGSGKSNTIAWLAYRLSSLHNAKDQKIFDSIVVITDRIVLDKQMQDTIYQFDHKSGVVKKIEKDSTQLANALDNATPIIISTLQKFPFVTDKVEDLEGQNYAVIVDEAHSSQTGEQAADLRSVLNKDGIKEAAEDELEDEENDYQEFVLREMAKRGRQENISFFAFTATPKYKTEKVFNAPGPDGEPPFHLYTMRQAIEENFIMDVLKHYTTYKSYYGLIKAVDEDPDFEKKKGSKALARFLKLHPYSIAQKTEVMVEHFRHHTMHKIGGKAKAMVVTSSRLHAVRYKQAFDKYITEKGYNDIKTLVAFSGTVEDPDKPGSKFTEVGMNNGIREKELPKKFGTDEYQILLVAEKYQTGFDQPLLHTMYVDKRLSGIQAVQTLSRLNRRYPGKDDTFVLDFVNDREEIFNAFKPYYEKTPFAEDVEPRKLYELQAQLEGFRIFDEEDIEAFCEIYYKPEFKSTDTDHAKLYAVLDPVVERFKELDEEKQDEFKSVLVSYRNMYGFLSQIIPFKDSELEQLYTYGRFLLSRLPKNSSDTQYELENEVALKFYRLEKISDGSIDLSEGESRDIKGPSDVGTGKIREEYVKLSQLVELLNERFGTNFTQADQLFFDQIEEEAILDEDIQKAAKANNLDDFRYIFEKELEQLIIDRMDGNEEISMKMIKDEKFRDLASWHILKNVYSKINGKESVDY